MMQYSEVFVRSIARKMVIDQVVAIRTEGMEFGEFVGSDVSDTIGDIVDALIAGHHDLVMDVCYPGIWNGLAQAMVRHTPSRYNSLNARVFWGDVLGSEMGEYEIAEVYDLNGSLEVWQDALALYMGIAFGHAVGWVADRCKLESGGNAA